MKPATNERGKTGSGEPEVANRKWPRADLPTKGCCRVSDSMKSLAHCFNYNYISQPFKIINQESDVNYVKERQTQPVSFILFGLLLGAKLFFCFCHVQARYEFFYFSYGGFSRFWRFSPGTRMRRKLSPLQNCRPFA